jgi:hypothetical protein
MVGCISQDELNLILDETSLRTKLNELDTLIETAPAESPAAALPYVA